ncbi:MAG: type II toxin-antitoxin system PrlF family antitoxin [Polaromonas sp.]
MLQTSKLTTKYQATVPTSVRKVLHLKAGDVLGFEINGNEVKLRRATPLDLAFTEALAATLPEWASKADELAFKAL